MFSSRVKLVLVVSSLNLGAGIAGYANQLCQARTFGAGLAMDLYLTAAAVPAMVAGLAPPLFASLVVPALARLHNDPRAESALRRTLLVAVVKLALALGAAGFALEGLVRGHFARSAPDDANLWILSAACWFGAANAVVAAFLSAERYARREFLMASITPSLVPVSMVAGTLGTRDPGRRHRPRRRIRGRSHAPDRASVVLTPGAPAILVDALATRLGRTPAVSGASDTVPGAVCGAALHRCLLGVAAQSRPLGGARLRLQLGWLLVCRHQFGPSAGDVPGDGI